MPEKIDRRTTETKAKLKQCLGELLTENDISKISIRELTEKTGIHRVTFYNHYQDIYELYDEVMADYINSFHKAILSEKPESYEDFYNSVIDAIVKDKTMSRLFILSDEKLNIIVEDCVDNAVNVWKNENPGLEITDEMMDFCYYRIYGVVGILKQWALRDYDTDPACVKKTIAKIDAHIDTYMIKSNTPDKQG